MDLRQLRYFQMIAKYESVTAAAKHFSVPQSAMSQTLARLEKELGGVRLFDRKNNRLFLNEAGERFLSYVSSALETLDNGIKSVTMPEDQISGPINLLVMENSRFVISSVKLFTDQYSGVSFTICHDYYSGEDVNYDLCLSANPFYKEMRKAVPLIRERMILAVCDTHPLADRKTVHLSELAHEKFISQSPRTSLYALTVNECRAAGFEPTFSISCDDPYFIRKYISQDMGIAIAPSVAWSGRFRDNTRLIDIDPPIYSTT